jgi:hypothetical protein
MGVGADVRFMVIASDVIYHTGSIKNYEANFWLLFKRFDKPVYAIPGKHDWCDALEGFVATFFLPEAAAVAMRRPPSTTTWRPSSRASSRCAWSRRPGASGCSRGVSTAACGGRSAGFSRLAPPWPSAGRAGRNRGTDPGAYGRPEFRYRINATMTGPQAVSRMLPSA